MKKFIRNISILLSTTLIAALGFTSCGSQKKALEEKARQEEAAARERAEEIARQEAEAEAQKRFIEESERRRIELERRKLVYGPPTTDFRPNINR